MTQGFASQCIRGTLALMTGVLAAAALAQEPLSETKRELRPEPIRGRLLYETHCIACHTTQMHWRDARVARDWAGLVTQVTTWQNRAQLKWTEADILDVARHLNATIYRLPQPGPA